MVTNMDRNPRQNPTLAKSGLVGLFTEDREYADFVAELRSILGDTRLLWAARPFGGATETELSRYARTLTWASALGAWATPPAQLGGGYVLDLGGVAAEYGSVPSDAGLQFGDGVSDQPFSIVVLARPDITDGERKLISKVQSTTGDVKNEYDFAVSNGGDLKIILNDNVAGGRIGVQFNDAADDLEWHLWSCTYDGSKARSGLAIQEDAVQQAVISLDSGTYNGLQPTDTAVKIGGSIGADGLPSALFDGELGLVAITGRVLSEQDLWKFKAAVNARYGLSL